MSPNAIEYRKIEGIDDSLGTAVTVQAMVFGNMNDNSGSGVLFTRNPSTGEHKIFAEYLVNAQGEDVVAGIRTPEVLDLSDAHKDEPGWMDELEAMCHTLEADYRDMVDAEFTVQDGELFMLQSRVGKRSAQAAFKIAVDMLDEGMITEDEMFGRVKKKHLLTVRKPCIDPKYKVKPVQQGGGRGSGARQEGYPRYARDDAGRYCRNGRRCGYPDADRRGD
jgi:pyruvate,orthophosphate dikinase